MMCNEWELAPPPIGCVIGNAGSISTGGTGSMPLLTGNSGAFLLPSAFSANAQVNCRQGELRIAKT